MTIIKFGSRFCSVEAGIKVGCTCNTSINISVGFAIGVRLYTKCDPSDVEGNYKVPDFRGKGGKFG